MALCFAACTPSHSPSLLPCTLQPDNIADFVMEFFGADGSADAAPYYFTAPQQTYTTPFTITPTRKHSREGDGVGSSWCRASTHVHHS